MHDTFGWLVLVFTAARVTGPAPSSCAAAAASSPRRPIVGFRLLAPRVAGLESTSLSSN